MGEPKHKSLIIGGQFKVHNRATTPTTIPLAHLWLLDALYHTLAGTSRNIYPLAEVQGCLATTFRCSFHLWQQIM